MQEMEMEEFFVMSLLAENGGKIGINIPAQSTTFIITAGFNLIEEVFHSLRVLYKQTPLRVSKVDLLHRLLSHCSTHSDSDSDYSSECASVFPLRCLELICQQCLTLDAIRIFVEAVCVIYPAMTCYEVDVDGNQYPLRRFQLDVPHNSEWHSNARRHEFNHDHTHHDPTSDKQLVKDVTDALRNKLLELRLSQEQGVDSHSIEESLMAIWQNTQILWNIDPSDHAAGASLAVKWSRVVQWTKSSHKKQVRADAKLVLATRLYLEEHGQHGAKSRNNMNHTNFENKKSDNGSITPSAMLKSINSLEFWCLTFLTEYCGAKKISFFYLLPFIHKLLCPRECTVGFSDAPLALPLNDQNTFSKNDSIDIAKNLRVHLHKYGVNINPQESNMHVHRLSKDRLDHTPSTPNSHQKSLSSSSHSYFDDDNENNGHNINAKSTEKKPVRNRIDLTEQRYSHHEDQELLRISSSDHGTKRISTPTRASKSKLNKPERSKSPTGIQSSDVSRLVAKNKDYLSNRSHVAGEINLHQRHGTYHDNPNDNSTMSSVVDARSPPRRQPHPYPKYSPANNEKRAAAPYRNSSQRSPAVVGSANIAWNNESALDYINPLNDTKLSINELDDGDLTDKHIHNIHSEDEDKYATVTPKYNNRHRNSVSVDNSKLTRTKTPPKELYDRNGHRIRCRSKSPLSQSHTLPSSLTRTDTDRRRKSFSVGDTHRSSQNSNDDGVAFGRRHTHCERSVPVKSTSTTSSLSKSTESVIDKDPEYAQARALYRLRHVRRQENLSKSEALQEEKLRRERLRAVELKADISRLRYSRNKNLRSPSPSRNLRHAQSSPRSASRHRQYSNSPTHRPKPRAASAGRLRSSTAPKFDFEAEEGRRRAAERIRVKRLEMRQKEAKMRQREYQKKQERWDIRDEKINAFLERQMSKGSVSTSSASNFKPSHSNGSSSGFNPDAGLSNSIRINWDEGGGGEGNDNEVDSAMREANEIAYLIDNTLGIQSFSKEDKLHDYEEVHNAVYEHEYQNSHSSSPSRDQHRGSSHNFSQQNHQSPQQSHHLQQQTHKPTPAPYSPATASQDMLCIKVFRAFDLPDVLGGTNPYVLFDWGHLGRASTHAVKNATSPNFNATLRFKSPSEHGSSLATALMNSPPLSISVYSRQESTSDTFIGGIRLDDKDMNSSHPLRVYLYNDEDEAECGTLEFQVNVL